MMPIRPKEDRRSPADDLACGACGPVGAEPTGGVAAELGAVAAADSNTTARTEAARETENMFAAETGTVAVACCCTTSQTFA